MSDAIPDAPKLQDFKDRDARNPFAGEVVPATRMGAIANAEQQRAVAEVQARMIIARSNPRDPMRCMDEILRDCTRPTLAKDALYQYARGGTSVSGPSIRLAEAIARRWGNVASGIKEISRADGWSECVAYAWDLETGYYDERQFQVRHWRDTKKGGYQLTDERDIYELIANMGQRRKRAVLLTIIPGDVVEVAVDQCEQTMKTHVDMSPDALKKLVEAFAAFSVTQAQIEKRCQCRLEAIRPAQIVQLRKIYASLRDDMSGPKDWFEAMLPNEGVRPHPANAIHQKPNVGQPPVQNVPVHSPAPDKPPQTVPTHNPPQPTPAAAPASGPSTDGFHLIDAQGEYDERGPWTDPHAWMEAYDDLVARSQDSDLPILSENNGAAEVWARGAGAVGAFDEVEVVVKAVPIPKSDRGVPQTKAYLDALMDSVADTTAADMQEWVNLNAPIYSTLASSKQLEAMKLLTQRCQMLGIPVPQPQPAAREAALISQVQQDAPDDPAPQEGPPAGRFADEPQETASTMPPDKDALRAADFISQIKAAKDRHPLDAMLKPGTLVRTVLGRWQTERPDLHQTVVDAVSAAYAALGQPIPKL